MDLYALHRGRLELWQRLLGASKGERSSRGIVAVAVSVAVAVAVAPVAAVVVVVVVAVVVVAVVAVVVVVVFVVDLYLNLGAGWRNRMINDGLDRGTSPSYHQA